MTIVWLCRLNDSILGVFASEEGAAIEAGRERENDRWWGESWELVGKYNWTIPGKSILLSIEAWELKP